MFSLSICTVSECPPGDKCPLTTALVTFGTCRVTITGELGRYRIQRFFLTTGMVSDIISPMVEQTAPTWSTSPESHRLTPAEFLAIRLLSGHSQASFAQALGKSQVTICKYENGQFRIPAEFTCAMFELLDSCENLIRAYLSAKRKILLEMSRKAGEKSSAEPSTVSPAEKWIKRDQLEHIPGDPST